jgi:outer membrane biosynthesis protein TonB
MTIAPDTSATPPTEPISPPALSPEPVAVQPPVVAPRPKPAKPTRPAAEPAPEPASEASHPAAPLITPQLSPEEQATYQRKTNDDIGLAERNLQQTSGNTHSAAQDDLREKIRRFIDQAREASKAGDLVRAQNLAQKARLLSVELVESL